MPKEEYAIKVQLKRGLKWPGTEEITGSKAAIYEFYKVPKPKKLTDMHIYTPEISRALAKVKKKRIGRVRISEPEDEKPYLVRFRPFFDKERLDGKGIDPHALRVVLTHFNKTFAKDKFEYLEIGQANEDFKDMMARWGGAAMHKFYPDEPEWGILLTKKKIEAVLNNLNKKLGV